MDTIRQEEFDLEEFRQDLQELAQDYIAATEAGDKQKCEDTFEALLHFGSEAFTKAKDEEPRKAVEAAVKGLKGTPNPHALWIYMMGYGFQESTARLYRNEEYTEQDMSSVMEALKINIITHTSKLAALKICMENCQDEEPALTQTFQAEFDSIVEKIVSLPNRVLIRQALIITKEQLEKLEHPLTTGPRALQAAGLRSYLKIHRAVMKRLHDIAHRIPPEAT